MSTLSRREEDTLLKTTKAHALKECDPFVKGKSSAPLRIESVLNTILLAFADCAAGRTVSVAWACREKFKGVQDCIYQLYVLYCDNN
jgi:COX assembly protein 1